MGENIKRKVKDTELHDTSLHLDDTDGDFPVHWKSGSLKYADFKLMAEGGTAKLFTCRDINLHREVVYKTLHSELKGSEIEIQRFLREARVTAKLAHPGTVPVYEMGRDRNGDIYFTMKRVRGRNLRDIIQGLRDKDEKLVQLFPLGVLVDSLIQICQTVAYAHDHGVIHRDLKPANILIGGFGEVLVLDWGLAKVWGEVDLDHNVVPKDADPALTPVGRRYGTPLYMAPELARGDSQIDGRVDVFSLGNILFEILTLSQLLHGKTAQEVADNLLKSDLPDPSELASGRHIPAALEAICRRALKKDPRDRYPSVQAMLDSLKSYQLSGAAIG
ncbi:MAG: serine/threonine-protein kinase [Verrucomicrobiota bacterium]|nr:serine/threonine-protein kinase [Verrucomicrobiota bacterium]MEE2614122.1 serine/threonine-protein kinase [Verrucomicrobiota bacterium]